MWHRLKGEFMVGGRKWHRLRGAGTGIALCGYGNDKCREMTALRVDACEAPPTEDRCKRCCGELKPDADLTKAIALLKELVSSQVAVEADLIMIPVSIARVLLKGLGR